jgi:hypothetical protein
MHREPVQIGLNAIERRVVERAAERLGRPRARFMREAAVYAAWLAFGGPFPLDDMPRWIREIEEARQAGEGGAE